MNILKQYHNAFPFNCFSLHPSFLLVIMEFFPLLNNFHFSFIKTGVMAHLPAHPQIWTSVYNHGDRSVRCCIADGLSGSLQKRSKKTRNGAHRNVCNIMLPGPRTPQTWMLPLCWLGTLPLPHLSLSWWLDSSETPPHPMLPSFLNNGTVIPASFPALSQK